MKKRMKTVNKENGNQGNANEENGEEKKKNYERRKKIVNIERKSGT